MPAKSAKQLRFMRAIAGGAEPKGGKTGPSQEVAKEFVRKTPEEKRSMFMKRKKR